MTYCFPNTSGKIYLITCSLLARINGVGIEDADLLEAAGVDTIPELAQRKADHLLIKLTEVNEEYEFVKKLPTVKQLEDWISQAKELPRILYY